VTGSGARRAACAKSCGRTPGVGTAGRESGAGYGAARESRIKRLRRIEGQVRGLQRMVDQDQYCIAS